MTDPACKWCDEPILAGEAAETVYGGTAQMHLECVVRSILGSVGHQKQACACYGGTEDDPPGLSTREAAKAAYAHHRENTPVLTVFVVYERPADHPDAYVLRAQHIFRDKSIRPDANPLAVGTLEEVRRAVPEGCVMLARDPRDEPQIYETWI